MGFRHAWSPMDCVCLCWIFFFSFSLMKLRASSHVWIFLLHWKLKLRASCFIPNVGYIRNSVRAAILIVSYCSERAAIFIVSYCSERAAIFIVSYCSERAAAIHNYLISFLFLFSPSSFLSSLFYLRSHGGPWWLSGALFFISCIIMMLSLFSPGTGILYGFVEGR